jgi:glycerate 2-kinase
MMAAWTRARLRRTAARILAAGLEAADPAALVRRNLKKHKDFLLAGGGRYRLGRGRLVVVAAGKAASGMTAAAERVLGGAMNAGLAVDTSRAADLRKTRLLVAGHPLPDARGLAAAAEIETLARGLGRDDILLILLSGGASALLPAPVEGVTLAEKARVTRLLLRSGAEIGELNTVRKHLSRLKGGGLARLASPARVVALLLSDVVGDDLSTIASGPTVPDPTTHADARGVLVRRRLWRLVPASVRRHLDEGSRGLLAETPKPGDPLFTRVRTRIVGGNRMSVLAAARRARRLGLATHVLTCRLQGEAREVGRVLASLMRGSVIAGRPLGRGVCLLAGGETTVSVRGTGRGGRNQELVLGAVSTLATVPRSSVVAALGTDGVDGMSDAAGAVADDQTTLRARVLGLPPPEAFLADNDSSAFFAALGDLIVTGPTGTNAGDIVVLLSGAHSPRTVRL